MKVGRSVGQSVCRSVDEQVGGCLADENVCE